MSNLFIPCLCDPRNFSASQHFPVYPSDSLFEGPPLFALDRGFLHPRRIGCVSIGGTSMTLTSAQQHCTSIVRRTCCIGFAWLVKLCSDRECVIVNSVVALQGFVRKYVFANVGAQKSDPARLLPSRWAFSDFLHSYVVCALLRGHQRLSTRNWEDSKNKMGTCSWNSCCDSTRGIELLKGR